MVFGLKSCTASANANTPKLQGLSQDEVELFMRVFVDGLKCFHIFRIESPNDGNHIAASVKEDASSQSSASKPVPQKSSSSTQEQKEVLEHFVTVFTLVDAAVLQEVFQCQIEFFFEQLLEDPLLLAVPQYLLASEPVSRMFAGILLEFLMKNLDKLGEADTNYANVMLRLFKLVFM